MKATVEIPEKLPVGPLSLVCPYCNARRNKDCESSSDGFAVVHLQRIQAAAAQDKANTLIRENMNKAVARIIKGGRGDQK